MTSPNPTRDLFARLILASASPRRRAMLGDIGLRFEALASNVEENEIAGETPAAHTRRLARDKARSIARSRPDALVLGVDTTVVIDGDIVGKPAGVSDARATLARLAGREHVVVSSYALVAADADIDLTRTVESRVTIRPLTAGQIARYVDTGEPMDKAGSYAVQGLGAALVARVDGSYTNVVGLPLAELTADLERLFGPDILFAAS
ncbi:Maf family protein [bacterium]|nr:Maf family protein [bacterium]